jgi:hypothetical protein
METYEINRNPKYLSTKYFPKLTKDLVVNETKISMFVNWLDHYELNTKKYKNIKKRYRVTIDSDDEDITEIDIQNKKDNNISHDKSCIIISGPHGSGKTSMVMTILEEKKYNINIVNFEKINKIDDIEDFINKISTNDICSYILNKNTNIKKAIVIDNVENIITTNEKTFVMNLIKFNEHNWQCPIIFICNDTHNKIINFIKKTAYKIILYYPSNDSMSAVFYKIASKEKLKFENEDVCNKLIKHADNDFRFLLSILEAIKNIYNSKIFTQSDLDNFIATRKMKDQDLSIFNATKKLLYKYEPLDEIIRIFETEKIIIPLMIQQHYINLLAGKPINLIEQISKSLSYGDIIENYIYEHNAYDIRDTQAFFQCINTSFVLSNALNSKKNPCENFNPNLKYPIDLNKTSIKRINYTKNILPANVHFKNMKLDDYMYFNKIINGLIKCEQYDEINELIKEYNVDITIIESILKINKLTGDKFSISTKNKKIIEKSCENLVVIKPKPIINKKIKFKNKKL